MTEELNRARQLFGFLKAFAELKAPIHRNVTQHEWMHWVRDLPEHPSVEVKRIVAGADETEAASDDALIRVKRPKLKDCPRPPVSIEAFLRGDWKDPSKEADVAPSRSVERRGQTEIDWLENDPKRVADLAQWKRERAAWAEEERLARRAMTVFEKLYDLYGRIGLRSEQVELMIGDGRLRLLTDQGTIDHPILLQRVELIFDAAHNEFRIVDADRPPELHGPVLSSIPGLSVDQLHKLKAELETGAFHPLGLGDTAGFFRRLTAVLGPRSEFSDVATTQGPAKEASVSRDPIVFLRVRTAGFAAAFDRVLVDIENRDTLPAALTSILGVERDEVAVGVSGETPPWGEPPDVLLSKPANAEQIQIARALERKRAVLVQGPPGTGKSHTIANLIGHLVAHGKRVLVTSHTTKALRVLREHIVPSLQPLCVSALDNDLEGRAELEASVRAILTRLSTSQPHVLEREVVDLTERRLDLNRGIAEKVAELQAARSDEYHPVPFEGKNIPPHEAAEWVTQNANADGWIPGKVGVEAPLPLSDDAFLRLYQSSTQLTKEDESEIAGGFANPEALMPPAAFDEQVSAAQILEPPEFARLWTRTANESDADNLDDLDRKVRAMIAELDHHSPWQRSLVADGHDGGAGVQMWSDLAVMVTGAVKHWNDARPIMLDLPVEKVPSGGSEELRAVADAIAKHLADGGSLGAFALLTKPKWKNFLRECLVDGRTPTSAKEIHAISVHFALAARHERIAKRWARQAEPVGLPAYNTVAKPVETSLASYTDQFDGLLQWWSARWRPIESLAQSLGLRWDLLRAASTREGGAIAPFERDVSLLRGTVHAVIAARAAAAHGARADRLLNELLQELGFYRGSICTRLAAAVRERRVEPYKRGIADLRILTDKVPQHTDRTGMLATLTAAAPAWARAIRERAKPHADGTPPGDCRNAWKWQQLRLELRARAARDERKLSGELGSLHRELRRTTAELIDRRAWLGQVRRVTLPMKQALTGWEQIQKRIGKGTGKRVPLLRAEARKYLTEAQGAVPVWIMPLSRVAESIDPRSPRFDVVIVDESSQCDPAGLLALYLADRAIVVGDDKQVSPLGVGQNLDEVQALINQHLRDVPKAQLYTGTLSLYDLAQVFGGVIRLREHFRCMPDIIEFSNELSYDFEIQPLRDPSAAPRPHILERVVAGSMRDGKTNKAEAQTIAALIAALIELPEYKDKSIGAITLLGDEQAHLIWEMTAQLVDLGELEKRRFVAGNSAQFQGDERDIIFLSMVDVPRADGPLRISTEDKTKQRYNVAASRAKDQLWLVHSLDPNRDLKAGDLRRRLIEYVRMPGARGLAAAKAEKRAESGFEVEVIRRLSAAGYRVRPQVKVGSYRIDMVVHGRGGQVAVECDGARYHPPEKIPDDLARQAVLERCGWRFVRIRSTAFYEDRDRAMAEAMARINEFGVEPDGLTDETTEAPPDAFGEGVWRRAWQIMESKGWVESVGDSMDAEAVDDADNEDLTAHVLNAGGAYQARLLLHLSKYKRESLGITAPGVFRSRGRDLPYDHILPKGDDWLNIIESERDGVRQYAEAKTIRRHRYFHHLNSSQAFALNLFVPFFEGGAGPAAALLRAFGQTGTLKTWLAEAIPVPEERTNIDAMWTDSNDVTTFCEVKLTEAGFGTATPDAEHLEKLSQFYAPVLDGHIDASTMQPDAFFSHYQVFRNVWHMLRTDESRLVFLMPRANTQLGEALQRSLDRIAPGARARISVHSVEDVIASLVRDEELSDRYRKYAADLRAKYVLEMST